MLYMNVTMMQNNYSQMQPKDLLYSESQLGQSNQEIECRNSLLNNLSAPLSERLEKIQHQYKNRLKNQISSITKLIVESVAQVQETGQKYNQMIINYLMGLATFVESETLKKTDNIESIKYWYCIRQYDFLLQEFEVLRQEIYLLSQKVSTKGKDIQDKEKEIADLKNSVCKLSAAYENSKTLYQSIILELSQESLCSSLKRENQQLKQKLRECKLRIDELSIKHTERTCWSDRQNLIAQHKKALDMRRATDKTKKEDENDMLKTRRSLINSKENEKRELSVELFTLQQKLVQSCQKNENLEEKLKTRDKQLEQVLRLLQEQRSKHM